LSKWRLCAPNADPRYRPSGTGASAEVNVHISIAEETKPWAEVFDRIVKNSLTDRIGAINRKKTEVVYDPEI
jgi:hypothetical protein